MSTEEAQVGGDHYRRVEGEQHHKRVTRLKLSWHESNITKYAERCRFKGAMRQDLEKVIHYAQLELQLLDEGLCLPENPGDPDYPQPLPEPAARRTRTKS